MTFRRLAAASVIGSAAVLAGCGGSDDVTGPGGSTPNVVGSYDLQSVNGDNLPATILQTPEGIIEVLSSNLVIRADGNFVVDFALRATTNDGQSETLSDVSTGTWILSGSLIALVFDTGGCSENGTVSSNRITFAQDCTFGARLVFEK